MRAVLVEEVGSPDVLKLAEVALPLAENDEVLVAVEAVGVNPYDTKVRSGMFPPKALPAILGSDIAGVVVESRSPRYQAGDRVFGFARSGGYAERATAGEPELAHLDDSADFDQAAGLPVPGVMAWQALFDSGNLQTGDRILIAGAAGGVGQLAVQLAVHTGAEVLCAATKSDEGFLLSIGASEVLDYRTQDISTMVSDVDILLDCVGGANTVRLAGTVRDGGAAVSLGAPPPEDFQPGRGVRLHRPSRQSDQVVLAELGRRLAAGELSVRIAERLPLAHAARAHELIEGGVSGKVLLHP